MTNESNGVSSLTRAEILSRQTRTVERVIVPEWGGAVNVRSLTANERDAWESSFLPANGGRPNLRCFRARLVALTVVDDAGVRLFSDDDAETLGEQSAAVLDRIFTIAQRLSGLRETDVKALQGN